MNKIVAYIDEYGAFGFQLDKPNVSTHFIISAIIVEEADIQELADKTDVIRQKYFQKGEIKSSKVGSNHARRKLILDEIIKLPFRIFAFVVDKKLIYPQSGLRYKTSFYKFLNNIVYSELSVNFKKIKIVADEIGSSDYMKSFYSYVKSKQKIIHTLFDDEISEDTDIVFENSKQSLVQISDFISGCLAYSYDEKKKLEIDGYNYYSILKPKINRIKIFPETSDSFDIADSAISSKYNAEIADICFRKAKVFIEQHKNSDDEILKQQVITLNYLLFRFMNNDMRHYIPTKELINNLVYAGYDKLSMQTFRNKIIAKLRDNEVIISSSPNGYKIPSTEEELYDFVNHGKTIILPMLSRLRKCNDIIKMGTNGKIDLFDKAEYHSLKELLEEKN